MHQERECLVMAKPAGARCNLRCDYCYYLEKEGAFKAAPWPMPQALLESYIAQRLDASPGGDQGGSTHFEWHGGEPTLLGLDYFRGIVRMQKAALPRGRVVSNGLQTNGLLIDEAWADFLAREGFSVGLSLDGPADLHDLHRRGSDGHPSHAAVMRAFGLLKERGVQVNLLCVISASNAAEPERVYSFFRAEGAKYLQFLPLVPRQGQAGAAAAAASAEAIGDFLCEVFDLWIKHDVGRIVIQTFDEALRPIYGAPHSLCIHREVCGDVAVLEREGSFYACDHYVESEHLIGNLKDRSLASLASDPALLAFGEAKREGLHLVCRSCAVLASCNGGCPKDRDGEGLSRLCAAYKRFFTHSAPALARLAAHMKAGGRLRAFAG